MCFTLFVGIASPSRISERGPLLLVPCLVRFFDRLNRLWTRQALAKHDDLQEAFTKRQKQIQVFRREKAKNAGRRVFRTRDEEGRVARQSGWEHPILMVALQGRLPEEAGRASQSGKRKSQAAAREKGSQNEPVVAQCLHAPYDAPSARRSASGERPGSVGPAVGSNIPGGRRGGFPNPDSRRRRGRPSHADYPNPRGRGGIATCSPGPRTVGAPHGRKDADRIIGPIYQGSAETRAHGKLVLRSLDSLLRGQKGIRMLDHRM
jgi:hypothetical protein